MARRTERNPKNLRALMRFSSHSMPISPFGLSLGALSPLAVLSVPSVQRRPSRSDRRSGRPPRNPQKLNCVLPFRFRIDFDA